MGKFFGTDGIRGVANKHPMTPELALALGKTVSRLWTSGKENSIVIGKDTRLSGDMLEHALVSGILSQGVNVWLSGIIPTPAVAFLTASLKAHCGIMVSASHNPFYDNGIKIFRHDGFKLSDAEETEIEAILMGKPSEIGEVSRNSIGRAFPMNEAVDRYADFLINIFPKRLRLEGLNVVMDCSHGATFEVAPRVFNSIGARVVLMAAQPNGKNINDHCGSQHPEEVSRQVRQMGADIGLAFDGDGDRLIAVDEKGRVITGDQIITVCSGVMKKHGELKNNTVVTTVMSNIGLSIALKKMGVRHIMANVGDRYVLEQMLANGSVLGGEDSGHMIFLAHHTTGDGILTALKLIEAMLIESKSLSFLADRMRVFPQTLVNVSVKEKKDILLIPEIYNAIKSAESDLGERGRVLVRYSGTQPLCRIMVEGPTDQETRVYCERIASAVKKTIGVAEPIRSDSLKSSKASGKD